MIRVRILGTRLGIDDRIAVLVGDIAVDTQRVIVRHGFVATVIDLDVSRVIEVVAICRAVSPSHRGGHRAGDVEHERHIERLVAAAHAGDLLGVRHGGQADEEIAGLVLGDDDLLAVAGVERHVAGRDRLVGPDAAGGTRVDRVADAFGPLRERRGIGAGHRLGGLRTADAEHGGRDEHRDRHDDRGDANDGTAGTMLLVGFDVHEQFLHCLYCCKPVQLRGFIRLFAYSPLSVTFSHSEQIRWRPQ